LKNRVRQTGRQRDAAGFESGGQRARNRMHRRSDEVPNQSSDTSGRPASRHHVSPPSGVHVAACVASGTGDCFRVVARSMLLVRTSSLASRATLGARALDHRLAHLEANHPAFSHPNSPLPSRLSPRHTSRRNAAPADFAACIIRRSCHSSKPRTESGECPQYNGHRPCPIIEAQAGQRHQASDPHRSRHRLQNRPHRAPPLHSQLDKAEAARQGFVPNVPKQAL
jgi:hypothetical protein